MTWIGWGIWMGEADMDGVADVNGVKSGGIDEGQGIWHIFKMGGRYKGSRVGFPIQGSRVQIHWVAPRSTQPFILPRSIK